MKVIAHRGACSEALENSWAAFEKAIEIEADRIELDVHLTSDRHVVVMHDSTFARTANSPDKISDLSRSQIEKSIKLINGESVPFLDEVLDKYIKKIEFNIEIKSLDLNIIDIVADLVYNLQERHGIVVSSFDTNICSEMARRHPQITVALLWEKALWWPGAFHFGPSKVMQKSKISVFHPDVRIITPKLVNTLRAKGQKIFPFVSLKNEENTHDLWSYLMTLGVDGLCTNYPRQLKLWLKEASDDKQRFGAVNTLGAKENPLTR